MDLKVDYFPHGPKAAETILKNGLKHQHSESYYETGEQFRSSLYFYDTLVREFYFFKSGDTIKNFPDIRDNQVHHVSILNEGHTRKCEFYFYDGKMITGTYQEIKLK
jgi:antitoxin component YwqK of YwqJK toxin-antitoxin module